MTTTGGERKDAGERAALTEELHRSARHPLAPTMDEGWADAFAQTAREEAERERRWREAQEKRRQARAGRR